MEKRLFRISEASEYLALARQTLYNMISERKIPFVKIGRSVRFDISDINNLIEMRKIKVSENGTDKNYT